MYSQNSLKYVLSYQLLTWHCCKWQLNGFSWVSDTPICLGLVVIETGAIHVNERGLRLTSPASL